MLEDKLNYVTAEVRMGDDTPAYTTHLTNGGEQGFHLDAFQVNFRDDVQMRGRIRYLKLYKNIDPSKTITINGTFVGAFEH